MAALVAQMHVWVHGEDVKLLSSHLRFFAHLVLVLQQLNLGLNENQCNEILHAYVQQLIDLVRLRLACVCPPCSG